MSYKDIYMFQVSSEETRILVTLVLLLHPLLQIAESMMVTHQQSTQIKEYRTQASVHQKKQDIALNRHFIGCISKPSH